MGVARRIASVARTAASLAGRFAKAVVTEAVMPAAERLIAQGANELGNAIFTGSAYLPWASPMRMKQQEQAQDVQAPQATPQQQAAQVINFQEAKQALGTAQEISKAVASMTPEEQRMAQNFMRPSEAKTYDPSNYARGAGIHGNHQEKGMSL
jgi:hypothetical protein